MNVNFDRAIDRKSTNDMKWHTAPITGYLGITVREDMIPMWIADTDFASPQVVIDAIKARADKEIYGYCAPQKDYYDALAYWYREQFGWEIDPKWICITPTVVAAINIAIRAFTNPGDGVIIQQPVYDPFASLVLKTKRTVINNALVCKNGRYEMDYALLEKQASDSNTKLMVLCSPHNPVGRVWEREELLKLAEICRRNNVIVVSDEIHSDIVFGGHTHTVFPTLSKEAASNTILCTAPGKTFNLAGLKISNIFIENEELRTAFNTEQLAMSLDVRNTFGIEAVPAAYSPEGKAWLEELLVYLEGNNDLVAEEVAKMQGVTMRKPEGSFLCWLDFSGTGLSDKELQKRIIMDAAVICVPGGWFGKDGELHLRLNTGCIRATLTEALKRIREAIAQ